MGICLIIPKLSIRYYSYIVPFVLDFSTSIVNPYGGQYIVLSFIGIHLFNHVKALLCWLILYILNFKKEHFVIFLISINWLKWLKYLYNVYSYITYKNVTDCSINCKSNLKEFLWFLPSGHSSSPANLLRLKYNLPGSHHIFSEYLSSVKICNYLNK